MELGRSDGSAGAIKEQTRLALCWQRPVCRNHDGADNQTKKKTKQQSWQECALADQTRWMTVHLRNLRDEDTVPASPFTGSLFSAPKGPP